MSGQDVTPPSPIPANRKFGWFSAAVFASLATFAYWNIWREIAAAALIMSVSFAVVVLIAPQLLSPLNRFLTDFGLLLEKLISLIVLGIIFFVLITPISLIIRVVGRDALKIKKRSVDSYWVDRTPPGPPPDSYKNQY